MRSYDANGTSPQYVPSETHDRKIRGLDTDVVRATGLNIERTNRVLSDATSETTT